MFREEIVWSRSWVSRHHHGSSSVDHLSRFLCRFRDRRGRLGCRGLDKAQRLDLDVVESMTVQVLLEQLQQFSGILVVDDTEVDLEHRTPRKNSLRAFPDVAGLEPADCTGRLCHVMLECFSVILRPWKTLQSPPFEETWTVELDLVHQSRLDW